MLYSVQVLLLQLHVRFCGQLDMWSPPFIAAIGNCSGIKWCHLVAIPDALRLLHDQLLVSDLSAVVVPKPDVPFHWRPLWSPQLSAQCVLQQRKPCSLHLCSRLFHVLLC